MTKKTCEKCMHKQSGALLIEVLVSILIFSVGILGVVGLQASAVRASTDAKYRSEAGLLANELIGKMWASDRTQATLQAAFASGTNGTAYQSWAWTGGSGGTQSAPAAGTVLQTLPGAQTNLPTVTVTAVPGGIAGVPSTSLVTITIYWQAPSETTLHNYISIAQIGG